MSTLILYGQTSEYKQFSISHPWVTITVGENITQIFTLLLKILTTRTICIPFPIEK